MFPFENNKKLVNAVDYVDCIQLPRHTVCLFFYSNLIIITNRKWHLLEMVRFRRLEILRITLIKINPIVLVIENYVTLSVFKWHVTLANTSKIIIVIRNRIIIEFYLTNCVLSNFILNET